MEKPVMTREKFKKIREISNKYQGIKSKMKFMVIILGVVLVLGAQCFFIPDKSIKNLCIIGIALHNIMFLSLYFKLNTEKRHCLEEMSQLGSDDSEEI